MFRQTLRFSSLSYIIIPGMKVCTGWSSSDESFSAQQCFQDLLLQPVFLIVSMWVRGKVERQFFVCFESRDTRINVLLAFVFFVCECITVVLLFATPPPLVILSFKCCLYAKWLSNGRIYPLLESKWEIWIDSDPHPSLDYIVPQSKQAWVASLLSLFREKPSGGHWSGGLCQ